MRLFGGPRRPGPRAQLRAATQALQTGDLEAAEARLRDVLAQDPQNVAALLNLGVVYHQTGQHSKAIEQFQQVTVLRPNEARAYVNLAAAENALGHVERSEEALLRALEIAPQQPGVHHNLGVIYLKRSQYGNAMAEFELELAVNPGAKETEAALRALRQKLMPG